VPSQSLTNEQWNALQSERTAAAEHLQRVELCLGGVVPFDDLSLVHTRSQSDLLNKELAIRSRQVQSLLKRADVQYAQELESKLEALSRELKRCQSSDGTAPTQASYGRRAVLPPNEQERRMVAVPLTVLQGALRSALQRGTMKRFRQWITFALHSRVQERLRKQTQALELEHESVMKAMAGEYERRKKLDVDAMRGELTDRFRRTLPSQEQARSLHENRNAQLAQLLDSNPVTQLQTALTQANLSTRRAALKFMVRAVKRLQMGTVAGAFRQWSDVCTGESLRRSAMSQLVASIRQVHRSATLKALHVWLANVDPKHRLHQNIRKETIRRLSTLPMRRFFLHWRRCASAAAPASSRILSACCVSLTRAVQGGGRGCPVRAGQCAPELRRSLAQASIR
jgi:hypothetical protein